MLSFELTPLQKDIRKDFIVSFFHSQGDASLQRHFFSRLGQAYRRMVGTSIDELIVNDTSWLLLNDLPKTHHDTPEIRSEFAADNYDAVASFKHCVLKHQQETENERLEFASMFLLSLINVDIEYQSKPRSMHRDTHASYFRNHVLLGQPTQRVRFDAAYTEIKSALPQLDLPMNNLSILAEGWSLHHNGQAFDPDGVIMAAHQAQ